MLRMHYALLALVLVGCSDPANKPSAAPYAPCENRIVYALSDSDHLTGAYRYDDEGHITRYVETNDGGKEVFHLTRSYDELGRLERQLIDTTRLEPNHREMTWEYDADGRVVRTTYDGWGSKGSLRETQISYDALGRRDQMETKEDGTPTMHVKYVYIEGEPSIIEQRTYEGVDDTFLYGSRYELLEQRWLARMEIFNAEIVQAREVYSYEDVTTGRVTRRELDMEADGILEEVDSFFWNDQAQITGNDYDTDGDGLVEDKIRFTYDSAGNLTLRTWDHPEHWVNYSTKLVWEDKRLLQVERMDDTSGSSIESWSFEYECGAELPMDVNIAPIQGFRNEMQTLPVQIDASTWGKSWEAL